MALELVLARTNTCASVEDALETHEARRDTTASEGLASTTETTLRVSRHNSVRHVNVHRETVSAEKGPDAHGHSGAHWSRLKVSTGRASNQSVRLV